MSKVLLDVEVCQLPDGTYRVTVNGVSHDFAKLHEAYWILKEAADQKMRELREQGR